MGAAKGPLKSSARSRLERGAPLDVAEVLAELGRQCCGAEGTCLWDGAYAAMSGGAEPRLRWSVVAP